VDSAPSPGRGENAVPAPCKLVGGSVSERPKERASKAREVQASVGSNPTATASLTRQNAGPPDMRRPGVPRSDQITCGDCVPYPLVLGRTTICPSYPRQDVTCTPVGSSANANSNCARSGGGGSKWA
jgi:hypothetical protein